MAKPFFKNGTIFALLLKSYGNPSDCSIHLFEDMASNYKMGRLLDSVGEITGDEFEFESVVLPFELDSEQKCYRINTSLAGKDYARHFVGLRRVYIKAAKNHTLPIDIGVIQDLRDLSCEKKEDKLHAVIIDDSVHVLNGFSEEWRKVVEYVHVAHGVFVGFDREIALDSNELDHLRANR